MGLCTEHYRYTISLKQYIDMHAHLYSTMNMQGQTFLLSVDADLRISSFMYEWQVCLKDKPLSLN